LKPLALNYRSENHGVNFIIDLNQVKIAKNQKTSIPRVYKSLRVWTSQGALVTCKFYPVVFDETIVGRDPYKSQIILRHCFDHIARKTLFDSVQVKTIGLRLTGLYDEHEYDK
jgi:hypothetical protein